VLRSTRSMSTLFEYLLWVDPFWGRCNMGAIELSKPLFILVDFRALSAIIRKCMRISYWDLNDFDNKLENIYQNLQALSAWKFQKGGAWVSWLAGWLSPSANFLKNREIDRIQTPPRILREISRNRGVKKESGWFPDFLSNLVGSPSANFLKNREIDRIQTPLRIFRQIMHADFGVFSRISYLKVAQSLILQ